MSHLWLLLAALCFVAGCASDPFRTMNKQRADAAVEIDPVAFFPQDDLQCGPAALATALDAAGIAVTPDELQPMLFVPGKGGSLQPEIIATARRFGRIPYVIDPTFDALLDELDAARPVIVLQNLGISIAPQWHYAVVVGYSAPGREIILRSGTTRRLAQSARSFASTWARSERWAVVLLRPGELPANADPTRYLKAVAAAEGAGQYELAIAAYLNAANHWPDQPPALLGLGNSYFATGRADDAEYWYRRLLHADADNIAGMNNLATLLGEQGRCQEADTLIRQAQENAAGDPAYLPLLARTESGLDACR
ncbi:MAG: PA2778 family cysteine peptidase [Woeseiaceae bacterium]